MYQNPLMIIVGHRNIISMRITFESFVKFVFNNLGILMVSKTKRDDTFSESQSLTEGFSKLFRLDRTPKFAGIYSI